MVCNIVCPVALPRPLSSAAFLQCLVPGHPRRRSDENAALLRIMPQFSETYETVQCAVWLFNVADRFSARSMVVLLLLFTA